MIEIDTPTFETPDAYVDWWIEQQALRPHIETFKVGSYVLEVNRSVFSTNPNLTNSSTMFCRSEIDFEGKSVLDLGAGSGFLAFYALTRGANHVMATDSDVLALDCMCRNMRANRVEPKIRAVSSDLFDSVDGKFDLILANLPIVDAAWPHIEDGVFRFYERLLTQYNGYLNEGGELVFSFASFGNMSALQQVMQQAGFHVQPVVEQKFGVDWYLFRVGKQK